MSSIRTFLSALIAGLLIATPDADAAFPTVTLRAVVVQQIHSPTTITYAPDGSGRLFVCDQPGKIYIIQNGVLVPTPFLNIASTGNTPPNNGPGPVITVTTSYSERGLLGLAFHPGYANPLSPGYRKFYLNYVKTYVSGVDPPPNGPGTPANAVSVIAEYQVSVGDPNVANPSSERRLLLYTQPQSNHNGGMLAFGPEVGPNGERYLYIGVGDGGSQQDDDLGHTGGASGSDATRPTSNLGNGQDRTRLFGKILRIDPLGTNGPGGQYGIPDSNTNAGDPNPFVGQNQSIAGHSEYDGPMRGEIYSYGMRNPWSFSFDQRPGGTNRLFCGDVGGNRVEEVDIIVKGGNYGWRYKEGTEFPRFSSSADQNNPPGIPMPDFGLGPYIDPIAQYAHTNIPATDPPTTLPTLGLSVTGGFVYRGPAIPALQGKYVFGDYGATGGASDGRMMGLEETAPLSGVFTLTQALSFYNSSNPIVGERILCFGEDESGEIYIGMKLNSGVLARFNGLPAGGIFKIVGSTPTHFESWLASNFPVGQYVDPVADPDGDGIANQVEYAYGFPARTANSPGSGLQASSVEVGLNTVFTITFRRDPLATDLTYVLQTTSDLVTWNDIVQSVGGAAPTGTGFVWLTEADITGQEPMKLVTAQESLPTPAQRFVRLRVTRAP